MKNYLFCQIVDDLSESILSMFIAPSLNYAKNYILRFVNGLKGVEVSSFYLVVNHSTRVFETFSEFALEHGRLQHDTCEIYNYLDLFPIESTEVTSDES